MPLPTRIVLPPSGPAAGGLLSAARPLEGVEWWRGVVFSSGQCLAPQNVGSCNDDDPQVTKPLDQVSEAQEFAPFQIVQAVQCTSMGGTDLQKFASQSLDVTREFGVAREFLTGAATGNPSLADAGVIGTPVFDIVDAVGCLEGYIAFYLTGRLGLIHASPQLATAMLAAGVMERDSGGKWRTASGNLVVVSAGYDGRGPGGAAPGTNDPLFLYATSEVFAEVGKREVLQSTDRLVNTDEAWAEDAAIVVFDPCFMAAIETGVLLCPTGS